MQADLLHGPLLTQAAPGLAVGGDSPRGARATATAASQSRVWVPTSALLCVLGQGAHPLCAPSEKPEVHTVTFSIRVKSA